MVLPFAIIHCGVHNITEKTFEGSMSIEVGNTLDSEREDIAILF